MVNGTERRSDGRSQLPLHLLKRSVSEIIFGAQFIDRSVTAKVLLREFGAPVVLVAKLAGAVLGPSHIITTESEI